MLALHNKQGYLDKNHLKIEYNVLNVVLVESCYLTLGRIYAGKYFRGRKGSRAPPQSLDLGCHLNVDVIDIPLKFCF